jgi:hypothetical protein
MQLTDFHYKINPAMYSIKSAVGIVIARCNMLPDQQFQSSVRLTKAFIWVQKTTLLNPNPGKITI